MDMLLIGFAVGLVVATGFFLVFKHGQQTPPTPDSRAIIEWTFGPVTDKSDQPKG